MRKPLLSYATNPLTKLTPDTLRSVFNPSQTEIDDWKKKHDAATKKIRDALKKK